jgi:dynein heavy chain
VAQRLIEEGIKAGHWVFLANCHLMTSWLPTLDKIIDGLENVKPHERFRLWLSSNPAKEFPIAILQVRGPPHLLVSDSISFLSNRAYCMAT